MKRTFQITAHIQIEDSDENPATLEEISQAAEEMVQLDFDTDAFAEEAQIECIEISWDTIREVSTK